jgi:hypothetical protein
MIRMAGTLSLALCIVVVSDLVRAQAETQAKAGRSREPSLDSMMARIAETHDRATCETMAPPKPTVTAELTSSVCSDRWGNTVIWSYRADSGRILAAGREIWSDSARIRATSDSIQSMLASMLGLPTVCPVNDRIHVLTRDLVWRRAAYEVQFRSTVGRERIYNGLPFFVTFEVVRDVLRCGDGIYSPVVGPTGNPRGR